MSYIVGDRITWQATPECSVRTGTVVGALYGIDGLAGYDVTPDDRRSTSFGNPGRTVLVSPDQVIERFDGPLPEWDEGVTLVPQQFTRAVEVAQYAADNTGGDIAAAIIELVNTGLSYGGGRS